MSTGIIDLHNHVMPGVDDGASTLEESRAALAAMREAGVERLVATPHLDGSLTLRPEALEARLAELDAGWARLSAMAAEEFPSLRLERGVELMLDTPSPDLAEPRLRMGGGEAVLMEFPFMTVPPQSVRAVSDLRMRGVRPIIAHPERYAGVDAGLQVVGEWRRCGGHLQVNAGSLTGRYGEQARRVGLELLARGWVDLLASDYHARGRLSLRAAVDAIRELGGTDHAVLLTAVNPARVLAGEEPLPVPPLQPRRGLWSRIAKVFR